MLGVSVVVTLCTRPVAEATLVAFYRSVRPGGFWRPVRARVAELDPAFATGESFSDGVVVTDSLTITP